MPLPQNITVYGTVNLKKVNQDNELLDGIIFINSKLQNYEQIEITYNTEFNSNVIYGKNGNTNTTTLEYTNEIHINGQEQSTYTTAITDQTIAETHVGKILVHKTDGTIALEGAIFKIATSKENAKKGFVLPLTGGLGTVLIVLMGILIIYPTIAKMLSEYKQQNEIHHKK